MQSPVEINKMNGVQPIWETHGEEKRAAVQQMFSEIAPVYDLANSVMSFRQHRKWRDVAASMLKIESGDIVADICCGTGDFLPVLRRKVGPTGTVVALDFCAPMLAISKEKDPFSSLCLADACQIPLASNSVNAVTVGWGLRNVPDIDQAHREIFRVLKPGGHFVSIDCAEPNRSVLHFFSVPFRSFFVRLSGKFLGMKTAYTYLDESIRRFKSRSELCESMKIAGFTEIFYRDLMMGNICIHHGQKPHHVHGNEAPDFLTSSITFTSESF